MNDINNVLNRIAYLGDDEHKFIPLLFKCSNGITKIINWLLLNNKSTTEVQNNKLFLGFIGDVSKE